jgi:hypothetical protein
MTRTGELAVGLANRAMANDIEGELSNILSKMIQRDRLDTQKVGQQMLVLPIDDVDIFKKRDRLIIQVRCLIEQS